MKLVPMAGLEINYYKGHVIEYMTYKGYVIEWLESRCCYRVYKPEAPQRTVCYGDTLLEAQTEINFYTDRARRRKEARK